MGAPRNLALGRCAGILFLAGALASLPTNLLLKDPSPAGWVFFLDGGAAISGIICLLLPWDRMHRNALHIIPPLSAAQVLLAAVALKSHGDIYLYFMVLVAFYVGYAFRCRRAIAAHSALILCGTVAVGIQAADTDPDAVPRSIVACVSLAIALAVIVWLRETLEKRERTDPLTGLGNRRALMEALESISAPVTLVLFDLDGFKRYNDELGHAAGDALLERAGARLNRAVLGGGAAFRLGGDELCVLLRDPELLEDCCAALREGDITASYGTARLPAEASTPSTALSLVDARMYEAKRAGRAVPFVAGVRTSEPPSPPVPASA